MGTLDEVGTRRSANPGPDQLERGLPIAAPGEPPFVEAFDLWSEEQHAAAEHVAALIEERDIEIVRVSFPDLAGLPRGKAFMKQAFLRDLRRGFQILCAPLLLGSADERIYDSFAAAPPLGVTQFAGSGNMVVVADPRTFVVLPWAPRTAWVVGDCYFADGHPVPISSRTLMKRALAELEQAGFAYRAGLEIECYIFRIEDPRLAPGELGGGPGSPGDAPRVSAVAHGYKYLLELHLDQMDELLQRLCADIQQLGLPLQHVDDEWGPGQVEFVFDALPGLAAADAMFLFRSAVKQVCRRLGYVATFMAQPRIDSCCPSGWHLHQSLIDLASGANAFAAPAGGDHVLSETGRHYVGGLLDHAHASSLFATPTVTGYRRRRAFSLAPDRATWGIDHRGVMVRVCEPSNPVASHLENRVAEPAANPYLHMAAQIFAGLDGIERQLDPGPPSLDPYRDVKRPLLPRSLREALDALAGDEFYTGRFGEVFVEHVTRQKESELARYLKSLPAGAAGASGVDKVTEWEEREYFEWM